MKIILEIVQTIQKVHDHSIPISGLDNSHWLFDIPLDLDSIGPDIMYPCYN